MLACPPFQIKAKDSKKNLHVGNPGIDREYSVILPDDYSSNHVILTKCSSMQTTQHPFEYSSRVLNGLFRNNNAVCVVV